MSVRLKTEEDIKVLRESGKILRAVLNGLEERAEKGVSLRALDVYAREILKSFGATPAFLGYKPQKHSDPYPAAICASLNDEVVHGIPSERVLEEGDLLSVDLGVNLKGYITDAALTVYIGDAPPGIRRLMDTTRGALKRGIEECVPGKTLGDVGYVIESFVKKNGMKVVRGLTGHGVGFELHEDPTVYNFGNRGEGMKLVPGLVLAIEPMVSLGSDVIFEARDGSFKTNDGSLSAHYEQTIYIGKDGPEILTA